MNGVISQDSDCFAYGARRVYRNFSMSMQGTASSIGGSIEVYDLDVVNKSMDLGRNKIVVSIVIVNVLKHVVNIVRLIVDGHSLRVRLLGRNQRRRTQSYSKFALFSHR